MPSKRVKRTRSSPSMKKPPKGTGKKGGDEVMDESEDGNHASLPVPKDHSGDDEAMTRSDNAHSDEFSTEIASEDNPDENLSDQEIPEAKYAVGERVYARDKDGVIYEAVIRRSLFGPNHHQQVQMGLVQSDVEAEEVLRQSEDPTWHYFVHYSKWNVNWDRWVSSDNVFDLTDNVKAYADRILEEHRNLFREMAKNVTGKKMFQTVDGATFLTEWRRRKAIVDHEMGYTDRTIYTDISNSAKEAPTSGASVTKALPSRTSSWTKASANVERQLRRRGLSGKRAQNHANVIVLPFTLKKILVEQWEIITQCQMLPSLPAALTVRQALDLYLKSKHAALVVNDHKINSVTSPTKAVSAAAGASTNCEDLKKDASPVISTKAGLLANGHVLSPSNVPAPQQSDPGPPGSEQSAKENKTVDATPATEKSEIHSEWLDMVDGIALLFDEALPSRLLYEEERPQVNILECEPELSSLRYSEVFGCEVLLRLFIQLPEMILNSFSEAEARPMLAKCNDFLRFLHKNHDSLFAQSHRKLNDAELKEQKRLLKNQEMRRKRLGVVEEDPVSKKPRTNGMAVGEASDQKVQSGVQK